MTDAQAPKRMESKPCFYSRIPHIADDDLNLHEYRLYGHYVKVCGMCRTLCEESIRETAEKVGMGYHKVIESRDSLRAKGYIQFVRVGKADKEAGKGETYAVAIADKWAENMQRYAPDTVAIQQRSQLDTVANEQRTVAIQQRTVANGQQKDQEEKKEEKVTPPAALSGKRSAKSGVRELEFVVEDTPKTPKKEKPHLLADHLEAVTGKKLTKEQRDRLAKAVVYPAPDGSKTEYPSPEIIYADEKSGFSRFVTERISMYKAKGGEIDFKFLVGDLCNYDRAGQGKQPGWLAWKAKRPELFAAPPAGSEVPLHQQNRVMDVPDEPHMPWMDADFDAEEAQ